MTAEYSSSGDGATIADNAGVASKHIGSGSRWYRRRSVLLAGAILVVLVITAITDLPNHLSRHSEATSDAAVINQVNGDIAACSYALKEALAIYAAAQDHSLTKPDSSKVPRLLSDDQAACSFTDNAIFELADIEVPGSPSGKHLNQMISTVTTWSTSDALAAIEDIQVLAANANDAKARARLRQSESYLSSDRAAAIAQLQAAETAVASPLPSLSLTRVARPSRL